MSLSPEIKKEMSEYFQRSGRYHGNFQYPAWAFEYAKLAEQETLEMPPVMGYGYKIYLFTAKNKTENCPVHINIHGGGFSNRHQINDSLYSAWLADQIHGVVLDVDYTLSGEAAWPVCLEQCRDAGRFAYAHCAEWGGDAKRISIGGYSAGGTLTMGCILKAKETGEVPYCLAVNGYGPAELNMTEKDRPEDPRYWEKGIARNFGFCDLLFDGNVDNSADPYFAASLCTDEQLTGLPPVLVISAAKDQFRFDNERLALRLATLGNVVTLCRVPDTEHGFIPHFMNNWEVGGKLIADAILHARLQD